jgi:transcription initiation factor IIE alpha subunit
VDREREWVELAETGFSPVADSAPPVYCPQCGNKLTYNPQVMNANREGRGFYAQGGVRCKKCDSLFWLDGDKLVLNTSSENIAEIRDRDGQTKELLEQWRKSKK